MHLASHQNTPRGCISLAKSACFFLTQPLEKKPSATRICTVDARLPQSLNCAASLEMRLATTLIPLWITAALSQFWFPKAALWLRCLLQILWREYIQVPKFKEFWSFTSCKLAHHYSVYVVRRARATGVKISSASRVYSIGHVCLQYC